MTTKLKKYNKSRRVKSRRMKSRRMKSRRVKSRRVKSRRVKSRRVKCNYRGGRNIFNLSSYLPQDVLNMYRSGENSLLNLGNKLKGLKPIESPYPTSQSKLNRLNKLNIENKVNIKNNKSSIYNVH